MGHGPSGQLGSDHANRVDRASAGRNLPRAIVRATLGHTDGGATTLKVYADWMPAIDRRAAEQLDADLAAFRQAQSQPDGQEAEQTAAPSLQKLRSPIVEVLSPPVDGRTTALESGGDAARCDRAGRLSPGDLLPTLVEPSTWFGIARSTALRAVSVLGADGLAGPRR